MKAGTDFDETGKGGIKMSVKRRTLIYVMVIMICLMGLSARAAMETEHSSRTQEASAAGGFTEGGSLN